MAKYRLLSSEELPGFEKEFVDYLVLNGITGSDWEKLKQEEPEKAAGIIDLFSDVIWEGILRKIEYLEHRSPTAVRCFQCLAGEIVLVAMEADADTGVDFTNEQFLQTALANPPKGIRVYTVSKPYKGSREEELFRMVELGCEVTDGKLFKALAGGL